MNFKERSKGSHKTFEQKKISHQFFYSRESSFDSVNTYLPIFTDIINKSIRKGTFPEDLKLAKVTPFLKKADLFDKLKYRPVSLLSHVSKVFESYFKSNQYILWIVLF